MRRHRQLRAAAVCAAGLFVLAFGLIHGCGGSGGGGGSSGGETGRVAVLLTDHTVDDFSSVEVTITRVELLSAALPSCDLWTEEQTLDLLDLSDSYMPLAIDDTVPAGTYDKLRLHVSAIVFTPKPGVEPVDVQLPGDTLDLNPTGRFTVEPGGTLFVKLDFDVAQTLSVSSGGICRPVVFVDLETTDPSQPPTAPEEGKLVRLRGRVEGVEADTGEFRLCPEMLGCCVHVRTGEAGVFRAGAAGVLLPTTIAPDDTGKPVAVYGRFDLAEPGPEGDYVAFYAEVVQVGSAFLKHPLYGVITTLDPNAATFEYTAESGEAGVVRYDQAGLFTCRGEELSREGFEAETDCERRAKVDGLYDPAAAPEGQATVVLVTVCESIGEHEGIIVGEPDPQLLQFQVRAENQEQFCVRVGPETRLVRSGGPEAGGYTVSGMAFGELAQGQNAAVFGPTSGPYPGVRPVVVHLHE